MRSSLRGPVLAAVALIAAGCAREDIELRPRDEPGGITTVVGVETTRDGYCEGRGPPLASRDGATCTEPRLASIFQQALCTCGDATFTGPLSADAFDSREGPRAAPESGADIGIGGQLTAAAALEVRGALRVGGDGLISIVAPFHVEHDFATRSDVTVAALDASVGGDLWIDGEVLAVVPFSVAGDVHQAGGLANPSGVATGGRFDGADFELPAPCPCGEAELLDIVAIVAAGADASDVAALGLAADAPYALGDGAALELPCGRFAFGGGRIAAGTTVTARGRATMFIDGDLLVAGSLGTDLGEGDELDVFVSGRLDSEPGAQLGSPERPGALRLYVGAAYEVVLLDALALAAALYAPRTNVFATSAQEFSGSLFLASYHAVAEQQFHHDRAAPLLVPDGDACPDLP